MLTRLQPNGASRHDVVNGELRVLHDDAVHDQPKHLLLHLEGRLLERVLDACAEGVRSFHEPELLLSLRLLPPHVS